MLIFFKSIISLLTEIDREKCSDKVKANYQYLLLPFEEHSEKDIASFTISTFGRDSKSHRISIINIH